MERQTLISAVSRVAQYREAIAQAPHNFQILNEFCFSCAEDALDDVVDTLTWICGREQELLQNRLPQFWLLVFFKEMQQRKYHGLSTTNALSPTDLHFPFAIVEVRRWQELCRLWLKRKPSSSGARKLFVQALVASNDIQCAAENLKELRDRGVHDIFTSVRFDLAFHETLDDAARVPSGTLPDVKLETELSADANEIIFTAGDMHYFSLYGRDLVASLARRTDVAALALHVFDATDEELREVANHLAQFPGLRVGLSSEWTGLRAEPATEAGRSYYHAMRYVRLNEFLAARPTAAAWLLDMDTIFNGSSADLFELLAAHDVSLWLLPSRLELHNQIAAGIAGFSARPAGRRFLRRVAGYILTSYRQGYLLWGIDQAALFAVFSVLSVAGEQPVVAAIPPSIYNGSWGTDRLLWPAKVTD